MTLLRRGNIHFQLSTSSITDRRLAFSLLRGYASATREPVELAFDKVDAPSDTTTLNNGPLVICHGLFGSKTNWRSLTKSFARSLKRPVYALDLRNHGISPHSEQMDYPSMASDVLHFLNSHSLDNVTLLGHSLGGKVVMALALSPDLPPEKLENLIVADIAPSPGSVSAEFREYVKLMQRIERSGITTKKDANAILEEYQKDVTIRQFLLTNLLPAPTASPLNFRVPLDVIEHALDGIGDFPYQPGEREWSGRTLFVKGERSNYINRRNIDLTRMFFPNSKIETLDAGHWVHAEKPREFTQLVESFINGN